MNQPLKTPIVFIIFNRPDCARRVLETIRIARPEKLYLIADGPRPHKPGESKTCEETRRTVEQLIDWPCEIHRNFSDQNLGCRERIITGLNWVFEQEEEAIILEDDIVPDPTFFPFCSTMLERYRNDEQIMQVAGFNKMAYQPINKANCFFSKYTYIWGWATWRRAWNLYQPKRTDWEKDKERIRNYCTSRREGELLIDRIETVESGRLDTWDFHWGAALWANEGLSIVPSRNLIKNIGFGPGATHTLSPINPYRFKRRATLPPPYRLPEKIEQDLVHDRRVQSHRTRTYYVECIKDRLLKLFHNKSRGACDN